MFWKTERVTNETVLQYIYEYRKSIIEIYRIHWEGKLKDILVAEHLKLNRSNLCGEDTL